MAMSSSPANFALRTPHSTIPKAALANFPQRGYDQDMIRTIAITILLLVLILMVRPFLFPLARRPLSDSEKLARGDFYATLSQSFHVTTPPYKQPPFCCIYIGLATNETSSFESRFANFAKPYGIRKITKHYQTYSGGPLANYMNDHIAFFVFSVETSYLSDRRNRADTTMREQAQNGDWRLAILADCLWPTNTSRINDGKTGSLAPHTGCIKMVSYDSQYPTNDFKNLAESLRNAAQTNWPSRPIEAIIYNGGNEE